MFDIGFWELLLILVVSLLVIGPERLPRAARVAGQWFGRLRYFVQAVRTEVDRQIEAAELRDDQRQEPASPAKSDDDNNKPESRP